MWNQSNEHASDGNRSLIEIDLENASDGSEYANVESYLSNLHGIEAVHLDRTRGVAHLTYDSSASTVTVTLNALLLNRARLRTTTNGD
jgi:Cu2+-exporting ATPase